MNQKQFYSQNIGKKMTATASKGDRGKLVRVDLHQSHAGFTLVLNPDELRELRDFIDDVIFHTSVIVIETPNRIDLKAQL